MRGVPIILPADVLRARGIPDEPLEVVSVWAVGDGLRDLMVTVIGSLDGRRWRVPRVRVEDAQAWLDAAQGRRA